MRARPRRHALASLAAGGAAANPAIVFDVATGQVIAHQDAFQRWYPASLTKLMTAYVAFRAVEAGELTLASPITMSKHAAAEPPSKMGFKPGQVVTLDNALKMLIVKSANDIAMAIGENVGGTQEAFVARMNAEATRLGMTGSHFVNPNGLHHLDQYTTAHDLALLVRSIRPEFPQYRSYFTIEALGAGKKVLKSNVDLLGRFNGADGMKTGFICPSGFNLVASATRNDRTLAAVVLGAINPHVRADQAADLLGKGFEQASPPSATLATLLPYGDGRETAPTCGARSATGRRNPRSSTRSTRGEAGLCLALSAPARPAARGGQRGARRRHGTGACGLCRRTCRGHCAEHLRSADPDAAADLPGRCRRGACAAVGRGREGQGARQSGPSGRLTAMLPAPIPVSVLTGFLGAGKTTLVNRLLRTLFAGHTIVSQVRSSSGMRGVRKASSTGL